MCHYNVSYPQEKVLVLHHQFRNPTWHNGTVLLFSSIFWKNPIEKICQKVEFIKPWGTSPKFSHINILTNSFPLRGTIKSVKITYEITRIIPFLLKIQRKTTSRRNISQDCQRNTQLTRVAQRQKKQNVQWPAIKVITFVLRQNPNV
jgi:hypothetical protein